jgi:hypothetical protein
MRRALTSSLERMRSNVKLFASPARFGCWNAGYSLSGKRSIYRRTRAARCERTLKSERTPENTGSQTDRARPGAVLSVDTPFNGQRGQHRNRSEQTQNKDSVGVRMRDGTAEATMSR